MDFKRLWYDWTDSRSGITKLQLLGILTIAVAILIRLFIDEPRIALFLYGVLGLIVAVVAVYFLVLLVRAILYKRVKRRTHQTMKPFRTRLINGTKRLRD